MRHITRKFALRPLHLLSALGLTLALLTPTLLAHAETKATENEVDAELARAESDRAVRSTPNETLSSSILDSEDGGDLTGLGGIDNAGAADGEDFEQTTPKAPGEDGDTVLAPEKPSGEVWQILKGNALVYLYLPALPLAWFYLDDSDEHPPLQTLIIERAETNTSPTWTTIKELVWNQKYNDYTTADYDIVDHEPFLVNYGDEYGVILYTDLKTKYRNFSLRITATVLLDGVIKTIPYDPILIEFPDELKPPGFEEEEGDEEGAGNNSDWNAGSLDGNRGGVGQGESTRVNPESSPSDLMQKPARAWATPQDNIDTDEPAATKQEAVSTDKKDSEAAVSGSETSNTTNTEAKQSPDEAPVHIPGFIWAVGLSGVAVALGVTIANLRRRRN